MTFWLHRFRKLDVRQQSHRKMLIDTFINAIFLYDDKMVITFNYKEGTKTITFAELQEAISDKNGSDLDCLAAPLQSVLMGAEHPIRNTLSRSYLAACGCIHFFYHFGELPLTALTESLSHSLLKRPRLTLSIFFNSCAILWILLSPRRTV